MRFTFTRACRLGPHLPNFVRKRIIHICWYSLPSESERKKLHNHKARNHSFYLIYIHAHTCSRAYRVAKPSARSLSLYVWWEVEKLVFVKSHVNTIDHTITEQLLFFHSDGDTIFIVVFGMTTKPYCGCPKLKHVFVYLFICTYVDIQLNRMKLNQIIIKCTQCELSSNFETNFVYFSHFDCEMCVFDFDGDENRQNSIKLSNGKRE